MNISAPFIQRPIATSLLMAGILFVGIVAYPILPVAPLPQIDFPTIQVSASLPGASPDTMASSVAQPLETQFTQIAGISEMSSTSSLGATSITIQFNLDRNIDAAANDVQAAINAAGGTLPKNLPSPPSYRKVNPADSPILLLSATSDTLPLTELDDQVETKIAQQISQIPGVGVVTIGGQQKPAIRIQVDPAKLATMGLSLEDVRAQISVATVNTPKGSVDVGPRSYTIYANDQLLLAKDWNDVIVAYRNGGAVRIRDVGTAVAGPEDAKQAAWATASAASSWSSSSSRAPMSSTRSTASRRRCRASNWRCRRRSGSTSRATALRPSAHRSPTCSSRSASPSFSSCS
jgi:HAE1 family hydrophobic/amphiphilic exporter-1